MDSDQHLRVAAMFDRASAYDRHAVVQRRVADRLAATIASLDLAPRPRILEIGCGTGFLSEALIDRLAGADWWITDIAPAMVERARARLGTSPNLRFAVMDGSAPDVPGRFDLICSSLAMQWFEDLPAAVERLRNLLAPGGLLVFSTLAGGSFAEWRKAHCGTIPGTPDYPTAAELSAMGLRVLVDSFAVRHEDARAFLRALKAIGAGLPRPGHVPLALSRMRQVMRSFEAQGSRASYVVATCIARAPLGGEIGERTSALLGHAGQAFGSGRRPVPADRD